MLHVFTKINEATNERDTKKCIRYCWARLSIDKWMHPELYLSFQSMLNERFCTFLKIFVRLQLICVLVDRTIAKHASSSSRQSQLRSLHLLHIRYSLWIFYLLSLWIRLFTLHFWFWNMLQCIEENVITCSRFVPDREKNLVSWSYSDLDDFLSEK